MLVIKSTEELIRTMEQHKKVALSRSLDRRSQAQRKLDDAQDNATERTWDDAIRLVMTYQAQEGAYDKEDTNVTS